MDACTLIALVLWELFCFLLLFLVNAGHQPRGGYQPQPGPPPPPTWTPPEVRK